MIKYDDIAIFLDLVSNPEKYKAALDEMKSREAKFQELLDTLGKAEEIPALNAKAKQVYLDALSKAEKMLADALSPLDSMKAQIESDKKAAAALMSEAQVTLKSAKELEAQAKSKVKENQALFEQLNLDRSNLDIQTKNVADKQVELDSKLSILKSIQ